MYNYSKVKIGIIYLLLNLFLFSNISFAQENVLRLAWSPNQETYLSHYVIYRDTEPGTMKKLDQVPKPDSTFSDNTVDPGVTYYYKLTAADSFGYESRPTRELAAQVGSITSIGNDKNNLMNTYMLGQNYPNPFNNRTTMSYSIEKSSWVVISIFDALGREVRKVENSYKDT